MIPVLVSSIVNRPDLMDRMLDSVDVPVGRSLIVDNGHVGYQREGWTVWSPPHASLGWPGTLNFGIEQTPDASWWLFVNNDAWFEPGKLAALCERMDTATGPQVIHHVWTVAAVNRAVVETVGLFDTWSFYPLYFDDTDYSRRCALAGFPVEEGDWCLEGDDDWPVSLTIRSDPALAAANNRTWHLNQAAYVAKWGGLPGHETFTTPWDSGQPLWATKPDPCGRAARTWP
jgi:hypothetical protein